MRDLSSGIEGYVDKTIDNPFFGLAIPELRIMLDLLSPEV